MSSSLEVVHTFLLFYVSLHHPSMMRPTRQGSIWQGQSKTSFQRTLPPGVREKYDFRQLSAAERRIVAALLTKLQARQRGKSTRRKLLENAESRQLAMVQNVFSELILSDPHFLKTYFPSRHRSELRRSPTSRSKPARPASRSSKR